MNTEKLQMTISLSALFGNIKKLNTVRKARAEALGQLSLPY